MRVDCRQFNFLFSRIFFQIHFLLFISLKQFFIDVTKFNLIVSINFNVSINFTISTDKLFVINFEINAFKNVDIEYEFRDQTYAKKCSLIENDEATNVCFDIDANVILIDENFFHRQNFHVFIRKMITSLIVRNFDTNEYETMDYVICFIYFENTKNDVSFKLMICREIRLISHFKINMLIKIDVIIFENIDSTKKFISIIVT